MELGKQTGKLNNREWDPIWDTLAAAYAEAGNFAKAIEFEEKALSLPGSEAYKDDFKRRLELYRSGKPYRENPSEKKKP